MRYRRGAGAACGLVRVAWHACVCRWSYVRSITWVARPQARIIFALSDPKKRAYSHWGMINGVNGPWGEPSSAPPGRIFHLLTEWSTEGTAASKTRTGFYEYCFVLDAPFSILSLAGCYHNVLLGLPFPKWQVDQRNFANASIVDQALIDDLRAACSRSLPPASSAHPP